MLHSLDAHNGPSWGNPGHKLLQQSVVSCASKFGKVSSQQAAGCAADCYAAGASAQKCGSCFQYLTPKLWPLVAAAPFPHPHNHH